MPKAAYSEEDRIRLRSALICTALELMAKQGIQHTTVEQIYKTVGISRTFFYSFFPAKEDIIVEALYLQQPRLIEYARRLISQPGLDWHDAVRQFLHSCCYGEKYGIAALTIEEQQHLFRQLSPENYNIFRQRQLRLFGQILECFGIRADEDTIGIFTNLCLTVMIVRRAIPDTLPLFVPKAADETVTFYINSIIDWLDSIRTPGILPE